MQVVFIENLTREPPSKSMKLNTPFRSSFCAVTFRQVCQLQGAMTLIICERLHTLVSPTHSPPRHAARLLRPYRLRGDSLSRSLRRLRFPHWRGWLAQWRCFQRKCNRNTLTTSWPE